MRKTKKIYCSWIKYFCKCVLFRVTKTLIKDINMKEEIKSRIFKIKILYYNYMDSTIYIEWRFKGISMFWFERKKKDNRQSTTIQQPSPVDRVISVMLMTQNK